MVCEPAQRIKATDGVVDAYNPQMGTERIPRLPRSYQRQRGRASPKVSSLAGSAVRQREPTSKADPRFIPPCISLAAHSELMSGSRRLLDAVQRLASSYAELHRAMREFMVLFTERGLETEVDNDSMQFAERMVLELQDTSYALLDRTQSPEQFFGGSAVCSTPRPSFSDLATGMQQYYDTLREDGRE